MNDQAPFYACNRCGRRIDRHAPETVRAVRLIPTRAMSEPDQLVEGMGELYHQGCYPSSDPMLRRKD